MKPKNTGIIAISECDDANIPVNCFITPPAGDEKRWVWSADNFCPRTGMAYEGQYEVKADTKGELIALVAKHVAPLYGVALANLTFTGENYYWAIKKDAQTASAK